MFPLKVLKALPLQGINLKVSDRRPVKRRKIPAAESGVPLLRKKLYVLIPHGNRAEQGAVPFPLGSPGNVKGKVYHPGMQGLVIGHVPYRNPLKFPAGNLRKAIQILLKKKAALKAKPV